MFWRVFTVSSVWFNSVFAEIGILLAIYTILVISEWRILEKAGEKGWKSLIPFYNLFLSHHIAGMPHIWFILEVIFWFTELILELVPAVPDPIEIICGIVIAIFTLISEIIHLNLLCDRFGKGIGFKIGMFILPEVFMPIIAFGSSVYTPPEH